MKNGLSFRKVKTYVSDFSLSLFQPRKCVLPHLSSGKLDDCRNPDPYLATAFGQEPFVKKASCSSCYGAKKICN